MIAQENFPVGSLLIRSDLRPAVLAFYRFARAADDAADDPTLGAPAKLARLARFEAGLDGDRDGASEAIGLRAALAPIGKLALAAHAAGLLVAFRQDALGAVYPGWADLVAYCEHSATPVGRFLLGLHDEGARGLGASDALCTALQILNHLQDLRDDRERLGRVYLPAALLEAAGSAPADLAAARLAPALRLALDDALDRVDALLVEAHALPDRLVSPRLAGEAKAILVLARRLAARLRREDPMAGRVRLSRLDFAGASLAGALRAFGLQGAGRPAVAARGRA